MQENPGFFWRATLWSTREVPVYNTIEGDRASEVTTREPFSGGMLMRALELPADPPKEKHLENFLKLTKQIKQKYDATLEDIARDPTMHRTDTMDCIYCCKGEIHLITDVDDIVLRLATLSSFRGTNHAWSNQSNEPALLVGCMIDAHPLP